MREEEVGERGGEWVKEEDGGRGRVGEGGEWSGKTGGGRKEKGGG